MNEASIAFGSAGGIDLNMSSGKLFDFGLDPFVGAGGTLTTTSSGTMTFRAQDGQLLLVGARMIGSGQLIVEALGTVSLNGEVSLGNSGEGAAVAASTFTGGTTLKSGILTLAVDSTVVSGSVTKGPIGTGTLTIQGGSLQGAGITTGDPVSIGNRVVLASNANVIGDNWLDLTGTVTLGSGATAYKITKSGDGLFSFSDATLITGTNASTIEVSSGILRFDISGSNTRTFNGALGVGTASPTGTVQKIGTGTFQGNHVRAGNLEVTGGRLVIPTVGTFEGGDNSGVSTSVVSSVLVTSGRLDLTKNELIVDYSGDSPIGVPGDGTASIAGMISSAFTSGTWGGQGITSSETNSGTYALGYAEATNLGNGTTIFSGITVDSTAVCVGFVRYGDANMSGVTDIGDFSIQASNFNTPGIWQDGDCNYDGTVNISDFALLGPNFNITPNLLQRGGPPRLQELFVAMLDYPAVYWEARLRPDIWWQFEEFESMNLGPIPPMPPYLQARGVPEPASAALLSCAIIGARRRR